MVKILSKAALLAKVAAVFVHQKNAEELHVTADGNCFLEKNNAAELHSSVTGLKLEKYVRKDYDKEIAAIEKSVETKKDDAANEEVGKLTAAVETAEANLAAAKETFETVAEVNKESAAIGVEQAEGILKAAKDALKKFSKKK